MHTAKNVLDYEANLIYFLPNVIDLFVADIERRLQSKGMVFAREKKQTFRRFLDCTKGAVYHLDKLQEDLWVDAQSARNWQDLQEENNYMARLILLYIDRISGSARAQAELYAWLLAREGKGGLTEGDLERFQLTISPLPEAVEMPEGAGSGPAVTEAEYRDCGLPMRGEMDEAAQCSRATANRREVEAYLAGAMWMRARALEAMQTQNEKNFDALCVNK